MAKCERLQRCLDLLEHVEPWFARDGDSFESRFKRILKQHHKEKGHGCDKAALKAWMDEATQKIRTLLVDEGRELFDETWEPAGEPSGE